LKGVRFAVIPEPQKGMELSAEVVKTLTGNDVVTARFLYRGDFDFTPCVNLWMGTNHLPQIDDPTVLDSDRIVVLPFNAHVDPDKRDKGLKSRLKSRRSASGILNWLLEGLERYRENPLPPPTVAQEQTAELASQSDRVMVFVRDQLIRDESATMTARDAYDLYKAWAESGNADPNKGKQEFFGDLRRLGILRERHAGQRNVCVGYRAG
jgi:putative DNA primase/helicase